VEDLVREVRSVGVGVLRFWSLFCEGDDLEGRTVKLLRLEEVSLLAACATNFVGKEL